MSVWLAGCLSLSLSRSLYPSMYIYIYIYSLFHRRRQHIQAPTVLGGPRGSSWRRLTNYNFKLTLEFFEIIVLCFETQVLCCSILCLKFKCCVLKLECWAPVALHGEGSTTCFGVVEISQSYYIILCKCYIMLCYVILYDIPCSYINSVICVDSMCIHIYIYIYRERERVSEREGETEREREIPGGS